MDPFTLLLSISPWTWQGEPRPGRFGITTQKSPAGSSPCPLPLPTGCSARSLSRGPLGGPSGSTHFTSLWRQHWSRKRQPMVHVEFPTGLVPRLGVLTTPWAGGRPVEKCCEVELSRWQRPVRSLWMGFVRHASWLLVNAPLPNKSTALTTVLPCWTACVACCASYLGLQGCWLPVNAPSLGVPTLSVRAHGSIWLLVNTLHPGCLGYLRHSWENGECKVDRQ